jgi:hypothetical protein
MGHFFKDARVKVALLNIPDGIANKISDRFRTQGHDDIGHLQTTKFDNPGLCEKAIEEDDEITALCLSFNALPPAELVAFIGNLRVSQPHVTICFVGTRKELDEMAGLNAAWRSRFSHYYRLYTDKDDASFEAHTGLVRDLFVADAVKLKALGQVETTPGKILEMAQGKPYRFWIVLLASIGTAVGAAVINQLLAFYLNRAPPSMTGQRASMIPACHQVLSVEVAIPDGRPTHA